MELKLGKQPATHDPRDLKLATYIDTSKLPPVPDSWGLISAFTDWGMLGNATFGDCAWAGPAHETMLWTLEGSGTAAQFTDECVLSDYAAATGFNPNAGPPGQNPTDQGSNSRHVARYRQKRGIIDAHGHRHKIAGYVKVDHTNLDHVLEAGYLFDAIGLGIQVPSSAQQQFANGDPWVPVPGSQIEGGHYVPLIGADPDWLYVVTWGKVQRMSRGFFASYGDETWAYLSLEFLRSGKSPDGFDLAHLQADLTAVR